MEKTTMEAYAVVDKKRDRPIKSIINTSLVKNIILYIFSFCCGNISISGIFSPFCAAIAAPYLNSGLKFFGVCASSAAGCMLRNGYFRRGKYVLIYCILTLVGFSIQRIEKKITPRNSAIIVSGVVLGGGFIYSTFNGASLFLYSVSIVESILTYASVFIIKESISLVSIKRHMASTIEVISTAVAAGIVFSQIQYFTPLKIPLYISFSVLFILLVGYEGGPSQACGAAVALAAVLRLFGETPMWLFFALTLGGAVSGTLNRSGKSIMFMSFFIVIVGSEFYISEGGGDINTLMAVVIGGIIFFVVPKKYSTLLAGAADMNIDSRFQRLSQITEEKLNNLGDAYENLSRLFSCDEERWKESELLSVVRGVVSKICTSCGMSGYCWREEKEFSLQCSYNLAEYGDKRGKITKSDMEQIFKGNCPRSDAFVKQFNLKLRDYSINKYWHNKNSKLKRASAMQLKEMGNAIERISKSIVGDVEFYSQRENRIKAALDKLNIQADVFVYTDGDGALTVEIRHEPCGEKNMCKEIIVKCVSKELGIAMRRRDTYCRQEHGQCILTLIETERYNISWAASGVPKKETGVSGDSHSVVELKDGTFVMALCDGMGSGEDARNISQRLIELLELFMECGFNQEEAITIINSAITETSSPETFSTLDICCIDRRSGLCKFIKMGGAIAFVLRGDRAIDIRSTSLPVGVAENAAPDIIRYNLKENDIIIMVTDGITDIIDKGGRSATWIKDIFKDFKCKNPQDISDHILMKALKETDCAEDDMTVLAGVVWKR